MKFLKAKLLVLFAVMAATIAGMGVVVTVSIPDPDYTASMGALAVMLLGCATVLIYIELRRARQPRRRNGRCTIE